MSDETHEGWTNRETWAVALHINNDQGWQESVHEALRELVSDNPDPDGDETLRYRAGEIIRQNVEEVLDELRNGWGDSWDEGYNVISAIGSMWRVNWTELGASFLDDLSEG